MYTIEKHSNNQYHSIYNSSDMEVLRVPKYVPEEEREKIMNKLNFKKCCNGLKKR
jgi:hypothetical protein